MKNMALHKRNPGAGNATGASEMDQAAKLIFPEVKPVHADKQDFLADLRAERRRCNLLLVSLDCIGLAVRKGVWSVAEAKAARRNLPVIGPDEFTADFLAEVMRDEPPRKQFRRAA